VRWADPQSHPDKGGHPNRQVQQSRFMGFDFGLQPQQSSFTGFGTSSTAERSRIGSTYYKTGSVTPAQERLMSSSELTAYHGLNPAEYRVQRSGGE
jgi:hypothetical protein